MLGDVSLGRKSKEMKRESLVVRLELKGYLKEKFDFLMKIYGASTYKSLVELLITERYEQIKNKVV
jgi:hypothetical protein